ncbi:SDR family NAD(P)-dependent oxidoreductase [Streptomyces sp. VNUA24]|uniref:SDR family NAD(P)-dependent oxidoreductase n=1 Tax=Streptomyces sp. VNUA24 TaxID=3031131 RepID=UPI0023B855A3|nr:SDR family NAD(P)-dependent oxidoreductase [Streptomyces sp. VNUA24]WEH13068.1 SDR family NAD(P)-dependent oxidoreductase [Streptomyces sp. VNUA24]
MARITDSTMLIVGASSGIGAEVARRLVGRGNRFVLTARRSAELAAVTEAVRAADGACLTVPADALDPQAAAAVVRAAVAEF